MLFVPLDVNWPDNPKIIDAGLDGAGLHATALCLSKRLGTDGVLHRAHLERYGATPELIDRLLEIGLFDPVDNRRISVHKWLEYNASSADLEAVSEAGRRGNHKRWRHRGSFEACKICNSETPRSIASSSPPDSPPDRPPDSPPDRERSESEDRDTSSSRARNSRGPGPPEQQLTPDRQRLIDEAALVLAGRRAKLRPEVGQGWIHSAARGIAQDRHTEAHARLAAIARAGDPWPTADELADWLEPPPAEPNEPQDPLESQRAAFEERAERNRARANGRACPECGDTGWRDSPDAGDAVPCSCPAGAQLAEKTLAPRPPEPDVDRNLAGIAGARGTIRSALTESRQPEEDPS
jgi:hypothetical protein